MVKNDLILRNPMRRLEQTADSILPQGGFGAVLARAGVGKTALMVQVALNTLLSGQNVLHISLNDPVNKVTLWYREVFRRLAETYDVHQIDRLWEDLLPHRFIMTFKVEGFSVPKLEERLADLTEQDIFKPQVVIIDGLPFDDTAVQSLSELKAFARSQGIKVWFTVLTHRHETRNPSGIPTALDSVVDLFDTVLALHPEGKEIHIRLLKGEKAEDTLRLQLDPGTMLVTE
ncbi:MAG: AAA family ATPase [Desulfobacterales bacterium]|nr:AAA family ATPase [Desulfobacterales bacterium]